MRKKWILYSVILAGVVLLLFFSIPKIKAFLSVPKVESTTTYKKTKRQEEKKESAEEEKGPKNAYKYSKLQQSLRDLKQDVEQVKPEEKAEREEIGTSNAE